MSCLYVTEQESRITAAGGKIIVECKDGSKRMIPEETLESIMIFGNSTLTAKAQEKCLQKGIAVVFLSSRGRYFGRLVSTSHVNSFRQKKQVLLSDNPEQCLQFTKTILEAKVHNQVVLARRYTRNHMQQKGNGQCIEEMVRAERKISAADSIEKAMGYEGIAARQYFQLLSGIIRDEFAFTGRTKRPPKDPFNSMLSLGYTILLYEIYAEIEARSLNPYFGFMHQLKENHPTLASDLLEEWRSVIVDATVLSLVQGNEINSSDFIQDEDTGAVILNKAALAIFIRKLENKMRTTTQYLPYLDSPVTFRRAIWWQVKILAQCIDQNQLSIYTPVRIR